MSTGERIKAARNKAGLKQSELAEKLGVAVITIGQYERGKRQPRLEQLRRIAIALGTTVSELVEPGYWSNLSPEELKESGGWDSATAIKATPASARDRVDSAMEKLSPEGQVKVADYAEDILPRYQAGKARQEPQEPPPAAPDGKDTTPPPDAPETAEKGG